MPKKNKNIEDNNYQYGKYDDLLVSSSEVGGWAMPWLSGDKWSLLFGSKAAE